MKKVKNLVIVLFLAFTFIVADLVAAPVTAQAAGTLKFAKSITLMRENGTDGTETYGIMNSVKSDKILNLKSSNKSVATVKNVQFRGDHSIVIKGNKQGTTTVSFTVQRKNGKKYSFKSKVSVFNYTNPLSKCTFGKTDYRKTFDKENNHFISLGDTAKKGKINVDMKKGYKLEGLYFCEFGTGARKKIKNGSTITLDSLHYLEIDYKNISKNYSYTMILGGTK